ncbi:MAG: class I SAM-dependent methyltransferase [Gammaproteobacteria bacterium]|nr:MAG: class I SAM-dependent methyltransferase [Gammaproteobacteria bacterium]
MKIAADQIDISCPESEIYNRLLSLDGKHILELGCGNAEITRDIATSGADRKITALEVDEIAHGKNLQITDLPNVAFALSGAQQIPLQDESVDVVLMFKSLHHVPVDLMETSMHEIRRVLKPGGLAYISEPIFSGDFNEILRLFHDEEKVREAAFNAVKKAVDDGLFDLVEETFFNAPTEFENFTEFENNVINVTHSNHELDEKLYTQVKQRFEQLVGSDGAHLSIPIRVDLLQRPQTNGTSPSPVLPEWAG